MATHIRSVPLPEAKEILGSAYFIKAREGLGWESQRFSKQFGDFLRGEPIDEKERQFFTFLTELTGLTFTLYKWGLLLFHAKSGIREAVILGIESGGRLLAVSGEEGKDNDSMGLFDLETATPLYTPDPHSPSRLVSILFHLHSRGFEGLGFYHPDPDILLLPGTQIAYEAAFLEAHRDHLSQLEEAFTPYKQRLESLQTLFTDTFGAF